MRRALIAVCHALAWCCLVTALPLIWLAGFFRGLGVSCVPIEPSPDDGGPRRRYHGPVLTETDVAELIGVHESAIRRGEAKWQ